jgi:hypothetical protein
MDLRTVSDGKQHIQCLNQDVMMIFESDSKISNISNEEERGLLYLLEAAPRRTKF